MSDLAQIPCLNFLLLFFFFWLQSFNSKRKKKPIIMNITCWCYVSYLEGSDQFGTFSCQWTSRVFAQKAVYTLFNIHRENIQLLSISLNTQLIYQLLTSLFHYVFKSLAWWIQWSLLWCSQHSQPSRKVCGKMRGEFLEWSINLDKSIFSGFLNERRGSRGQIRRENPNQWLPVVDVAENEEEITIYAELPGIKKEDVHLDISNGILTLSGEKKSTKRDDNTNFHRYAITLCILHNLSAYNYN